jgi:hypothetical protein
MPHPTPPATFLRPALSCWRRRSLATPLEGFLGALPDEPQLAPYGLCLGERATIENQNDPKDLITSTNSLMVTGLGM